MVTHPGVNPSFDMEAYPFDEQTIIRRIARSFHITRNISPIIDGNSECRAFLMRPSNDMSIILNVERELVVLFSPYDNFEARSLKLYESIYEKFDDIRIDKSVRFILSKDKNIESQIRHFIQQDPEYPIIVPAEYELFLGSYNENDLIKRIRSNYTIRDLFGYTTPLRQDYYYFGRENVVNHVVDLHRSGQNSSLFGLRKSGKTSTIFAIQRKASALGFKVVTVDCEDLSIHAKRYKELLFKIVNDIRKACGVKQAKEPFGSDDSLVSEQFRALIDSTLSQVKSNVLVVFDEIENISPNTAASDHWRDEKDCLYFWQVLRSHFQSNSKYKLTFCFVGTNPSLFEMDEIHNISNPLYLFAPKNYISGLPEEAIHSMCRELGYFMGLNFSSRIISKIYDRFGGHPFFTRQLCSAIHQIADLDRPINVSEKLLTACPERA